MDLEEEQQEVGYYLVLLNKMKWKPIILIGIMILMSILVNAQVTKINFPDINVSYYSKINDRKVIVPYLKEASNLNSWGNDLFKPS